MFSWVGCPGILTQLTFPTACSPAAVLSLQGGCSPAVGPTPAPPPWTAGVVVLLWRATVDRRASLTRTCSRWRAGSCADVPSSPRLQSRTGTTITYCFLSQRSRLAGESLLLVSVTTWAYLQYLFTLLRMACTYYTHKLAQTPLMLLRIYIYSYKMKTYMYVNLRMQTTSELIRSFFTSKLNLDILGDYTLARDEWN